MDNLEDKHIDDFFRDGSEQHAFPFKESSWDKMESLIEKDKKKKFLGFYLSGFVLTLTIIGAVIFFYATNNTIIDSDSSVAQVKTVNEINNKSIDKLILKTNISKEEKIASTSASKKMLTALEKESKSNQNLIATKTNKKQNLETQKQKTIESFTQNKNKDTSIHTKIESPFTIERNTIDQKLAITKNIISSKSIISPEQVNNEFDTPELLQGIKLPVFENEKYTFKERALSFNESTDVETSKSAFSVGLVAGMEYSSVGFSSKSRPGYRFGIEVSHQFKNRFELTSGVIFSHKKYITEAQNYSFSQDALMDNIMPEMVHGKCGIVEIPVEFSYYLNSFDQSTFYFSLGATTFLMRSEWYDFEYESMYDDMDELPRSWSDDGINNHLFGVGTIAIGYQKQINKNMAFQFEPYFQIPFTGIGTGQVNLVSGGLQLKVLFKR